MNDQAQAIPAPLAGQLLRIFWLAGGNAIIYASWVIILLTSAPLPCVWDAVVLITVGLVIGARRIDIMRFGGRTLDGEPATLADWRHHVIIVLGSTVLGEFVAHYLGGSLTA